MNNNNKFRENKVSVLLLSLFMAYLVYKDKNKDYFDWIYFAILYLLNLLYILFIGPFLENKLQIRKLANYNSRRESLFNGIIVLPPFFLILKFVEWSYKYFQINNKII